MIRVYVLSDEEVAHSETLLWSRVREQQLRPDTPTRCAHAVDLQDSCDECRQEGSRVRTIRMPV